MVSDEMTPRTVVSAFEMTQTIKEVLDENTILRFSRIPVYEENIDNVRGLVIRSEILMAASRDEWDLELKDIMKPILKIEQGSTIEQALDVFLSNRQQFALCDEFGDIWHPHHGRRGGALLGKEIVDELDEVEDMRELHVSKRLKRKKNDRSARQSKHRPQPFSMKIHAILNGANHQEDASSKDPNVLSMTSPQ